jgi:hypothetical protein
MVMHRSGGTLSSPRPAFSDNDVSAQMVMNRVAQTIVSRARQQGYVRSNDIRDELKRIGEPATEWKEVVRKAGASLALKNGRYYYVSPLRARIREGHRHLQGVKRAARTLIRTYKAASVHIERRNHRRINFILPVQVISTNGKTHQMVTQDISLNGVRVIGSQSLRGQKARVLMPNIDHGGGQWLFTVHFLWSSTIGDHLVESGGIFLEVSEEMKHGK